MISIYITVQSTTLGSRSYLFLSDRLPLKSMEQSLSMDKIERPQCSGRYIFDSYLGKFCTQLLLILNNIFPFRLKTLLPQLHRQNTFQRVIKNLPLIYKQCREENTVKKYQQYLKTWKECTTKNQVCFLPGELVYSTLIDAQFLRHKIFHISHCQLSTLAVISFFLLPCSKPQNESQSAKLKRKRYYISTI